MIGRILLGLVLLTAPAAALERIISLAPSVTETLFALGVGDRVVGVSTYCDYPVAATTIDRVGTFLQPNVERILAKRPDLVIAVPSPGNRAPVERLQELGIKVLVVNPERIAEILASIRAIADAVGVPQAGVALVARIDKVGTFLQPNVERILAKRPDLVIAVPSPGNRAPVESLRELGLEVLIVNPERIGEILDAIRRIALAVGVPQAGERLVARIAGELGAVEARVAGAPPVRTLLLVGRSPFIAAGAGTYQDELITRGGGLNVAAGSGQAWPNLSLEFVVVQAPQVIIDASMGSEEAADRAASLAFWDEFPSIPAVRDRRVHGYRAYELLRPGPRVAETLASVARFLHPERFAADAR